MAQSPVSEAVTLSDDLLSRYRYFSLYNSPYPAHDWGCAVDLYPETNAGRSPVTGEVLDTRTVRCPDRPYAVGHDHLILVAVDAERSPVGAADEVVARILHVDPAVEPGTRVEVGDSLGEMVRSGFFGQWVDNHIHLGFRRREQNAYRAAGSLSVVADVEVEPLPWDGTGTVVETGETYALLDAPSHPAPGERFVAVAADEGIPLDGGLAHYAGGGTLAPAEGAVSLLGERVGTAVPRSVGASADVTWDAIDVLANGERVTGLSLFAARDGDFGAKLVCPDHDFSVGDTVEVAVRESEDPIRLG